MKTLSDPSHLEELKQHVEEMRRYVHGLDGLSGGLHWQTGTLGVNDTGQHQDHRAKTAPRGCVISPQRRLRLQRENVHIWEGKGEGRQKKKKNPTVELFNLQLGGG